jgi:hypothetical protein
MLVLRNHGCRALRPKTSLATLFAISQTKSSGCSTARTHLSTMNSCAFCNGRQAAKPASPPPFILTSFVPAPLPRRHCFNATRPVLTPVAAQ